MTGLSISIVDHKLPTNPICTPVKQKLEKFKPDMSLKIKEEVTKNITAKVPRVVEYPTWLSTIVPIPKESWESQSMCWLPRSKQSKSQRYFPFTNIHILIENYAKHEHLSFVDCFTGYHQIWMDEEDAEKTAFITPWWIYCYKMMPFGVKNAEVTYIKAMTTIFHGMIH